MGLRILIVLGHISFGDTPKFEEMIAAAAEFEKNFNSMRLTAS